MLLRFSDCANTMPSIPELQKLYDQNRFLEAFRQTSEYWNPSVGFDRLSVDQIVLGGRLAWRLGGPRLARWIFRTALDLHPSDPRVNYFARDLRRRPTRLFDQLRDWERDASISDADPDTQASWLGTRAVTWASLRDFSRAHDCIKRGQSLEINQGWLLTCQSNVFGVEDRWREALESAERAWEMVPGTPFAAYALGESLLNLGRVREAAERFVIAADNCESFEIVHLACWYLCALAETVEGDERTVFLRQARDFAEKLPSLAPLADRETRELFARARLDVAEMEDDHAAMERCAKEVRSPFHRTVLENLRKNPNGIRIRLPFHRAIQKHQTCLPTSLSSSLAAMGISIDADAMASEITFGGTPEWAAAEWLIKRGLEVRFFVVTPDVAVRLIKNGIAFVMTLETDGNSHAVAVVGLDEAAGTLLVHDPESFRTSEYLLSSIGEGESPLGPKGTAAVPPAKLETLNQLLPQADVDAATASEAHQQAVLLHGPAAASKIVDELEERQPCHPITRLLRAIQNIDDGRVGAALVEFREMTQLYPASAFVRAKLLACSRSLGDTALMRKTLASVVDRGILPGIQSQQNWFYPPGLFVSEYADLLRASAVTHDQAELLLHTAIRRQNSCAQAWHVLGDLLWNDRNVSGYLLAYRIAACLATNYEHYARAYSDALAYVGRQEEGLHYLEARARNFGASSQATATWITWIGTLEDSGHPERALAASRESLEIHGNSSDLLEFVISFLARMGQWQEAEALLNRLETAGNSTLFHEAAADFYQRLANLDQSLHHAEMWINESPLSIPARREFLYVIAKRDGGEGALRRVAEWISEHPGHDELEVLYCQYLDQTNSPKWKKYSLLLRRVRRNSEDGWAWRELAFAAISDYESGNDRRRKKLAPRIGKFIVECDRVAPEEAATLRVHAQWCEARGEWAQAVDGWMESIDLEPNSSYSWRQLWDCLARSTSEKRQQCWQSLSAKLMSCTGRISVAREAITLAAKRFGIVEAERSISTWKGKRPDDLEITEAFADLLLEYGNGRTDYQRALEMLQHAVERFPFHSGLRFSLADAFRNLGQFKNAEDVLDEIIRRYPDNSAARIRVARVQQRRGEGDAALRTLATAANLDPRNSNICEARAELLIAAGRMQEARSEIQATTSRFPPDVPWRETAINLLSQCGDDHESVQTARDGVKVFPRGAYLWFLLGRTLNGSRHFAAQGEIESCFRRSLELNRALFVAADSLAMFLAEQHRYAEAEEVMRKIQKALSDPSPALGRLAWITREKGDKSAAREEMAGVLRATPWYQWGWKVMMDWLVEDKAWIQTRDILGPLVPELKTDVYFRRHRLLLLEKTALPKSELDSEWNSLLLDFPEDVSLHLNRYDSLRDSKRLSDATAVLKTIRPIAQDSPYFLTRFVEAIAADQSAKDETLAALVRIFFAPSEESIWPVDHAWKAIRGAHLEESAYQKACDLLANGKRPTLRALSTLASYAVERGKTEKRTRQPLWRTWFPDRGSQEVLRLLHVVDSSPWSREKYRGILLKQLCDSGYSQLVANYWTNHKALVDEDVGTWAQVGRALVSLRRKSKARKLLADWRRRSGVEMWAVTNYVQCLSALRTAQLRETVSTCHDALKGLPHDQCAKYLIHRQAEACVLLGDTNGLCETYNENRSYFNSKLDSGEWFDARRKYLIGDLPLMARLFQENNLKKYRRRLWSLRWKRISEKFRLPSIAGRRIKIRWIWILFWALWMLLHFALNQ